MRESNSHTASLVEIFSSLQGEGAYVGRKMTFVRFGSCNLKCRFCDTPQGMCTRDHCLIEKVPGSAKFDKISNPVSAAQLCEMMSRFDDSILSITGGEPLKQAAFLEQWLPSQRPNRTILLETNGVLHEELKILLPNIDIISMDFKLPSSTGEKEFWEEHSIFLQNSVASGKEIYIKIVVTPETTDHDIEKVIRIITSINKYIPTFIQPASPTLRFHKEIQHGRIKSLQRLCSAYLRDVRVQPQMHKHWGIL
ncbi:MAG TPA: 7-carboxy-7-deazaguanine synthase QueE [bacterium]|nr:7-carboxy-7-deazaguanine synthase QueE [Myxococcales bacterium]OQA60921.1 MAG: 7-carboxy-7-deazaguanine synthase [bacterium ADurb.Bin270]HPW44786.1 7-carboxy-7-deazaguanine synthase QueE [bacterium]HQC51146.1 7-carboxy-7-deazaguanine synthase QueE [bacterium]HQG12797.1 7-carboxy-7-deazaguanine synthase QueE [bacterium]